MKTIKFILFALLCFALNGCETPRNSRPPVSFEFRFVDAQGNDLVKGIQYNERTSDGMGYLIQDDQYQAYRADDEQSAKYTRTKLHLKITEQQKQGLESGAFNFTNNGLFAPVVSLKLECEHIFGDKQEHLIISYWKDNHCTKITLDGKEFPVVKNGIYDLHTTFVIDKPN